MSHLNNLINKYSRSSSIYVGVSSIDSAIGTIIIGANNNFLLFVIFEDSKNLEKTFQTVATELNCKFIVNKNKILIGFENELNQYFEGKLKKFTIPIQTIGSDFQREVWNKLMLLPYGSTQSYGDLAKEMGRPASHSRAVGAACGANSHLLVIPCHRVVAAASKGGFSCGKDRKEWLLEHEKKFAA